MFKKDMSEEQLGQRKLFQEILATAGWDTGGWDDFFESGVIDVSPEAKAEFANDHGNLELTYDAAGRSIALLIGAKDLKDFVKFHFRFGSRLKDVLELIIENQNTLSRKGYTDFIKRAIPTCEEVLMEVAGQGLVRLSL